LRAPAFLRFGLLYLACKVPSGAVIIAFSSKILTPCNSNKENSIVPIQATS